MTKSRIRISLDVIKEKRDEIIRIAEKHGASAVRVFGSVASGDNSADSDLDILVKMEDSRSLVDHVALIRELEEILECRVDVVPEDTLHSRIRQRVLSEAVPI